MNPGHAALETLREMLALFTPSTVGYFAISSNDNARRLYERADGIVKASTGLDGNGITQRPAGENRNLGWCSSCGAYHELTGDTTEVFS